MLDVKEQAKLEVRLRDAHIIKDGHFELSTKMHTPVWIDMPNLIFRPELHSKLAELTAQRIYQELLSKMMGETRLLIIVKQYDEVFGSLVGTWLSGPWSRNTHTRLVTIHGYHNEPHVPVIQREQAKAFHAQQVLYLACEMNNIESVRADISHLAFQGISVQSVVAAFMRLPTDNPPIFGDAIEKVIVSFWARTRLPLFTAKSCPECST